MLAPRLPESIRYKCDMEVETGRVESICSVIFNKIHNNRVQQTNPKPNPQIRVGNTKHGIQNTEETVSGANKTKSTRQKTQALVK